MSDRVVELLGGQRNVVRGAAKMPPERKQATSSLKVKLSVRADSKSFRTAIQSKVYRTKSILSLSEHLVMPATEIYELINLRGRTAQRREQQGELSAEESDRLYRIARVTQKAETAFASREKARDWLKRPNRMFDGFTPISLLGTDAGAEAVSDELTRIEYGELY